MDARNVTRTVLFSCHRAIRASAFGQMKPFLFPANAAVKALLLSLVLLCACLLADASSLHKNEQRLVAGKLATLKSKHKEEGPKVNTPAGTKLPTAKTDTSTLTPHDKEKVASTKISKSEVIKTEESSNDSPAVKQPASKKPGSMVKAGANVLTTSTTVHGASSGKEIEKVPKQKPAPPPDGPLPRPSDLPPKGYERWNSL